MRQKVFDPRWARQGPGFVSSYIYGCEVVISLSRGWHGKDWGKTGRLIFANVPPPSCMEGGCSGHDGNQPDGSSDPHFRESGHVEQ
ncbi:hypothetical protein TNIN_372901 [Trichonephila inaurata madagascariensis]|uniref:Uncharacterized protein n=1 Tax=Trichonephila inaurata madagascariensis TaxID=2747483 RepID=A0A8X6YFB5_9ARAC|nr:hypothetical protein TNIN_372901 [Trichonephila inaurata madagascariensis]